MNCVKSGVTKRSTRIATTVACLSLVASVPLFCLLIKERQQYTASNINMQATPCTQGDSVSEWLGAEAAFIEHGAESYRKPERALESWFNWREGGILSQYNVFTSDEYSLINASDASKSYKKCRDFLDLYHKGQEFSRGTISSYLNIIGKRNSETGNLSVVNLSMMAGMSDYFLRRHPSQFPSNDFDIWFDLEVRSLKSSDIKSIKLDEFSRGTELSTLVGSLSAVLALSNSYPVADTVFDFVDSISNYPEKYNVFPENGLNSNSVIRGFEHSVTYLESVVKSSGNSLNEDDVKYLISSIMREAVKPGKPYSDYLLLKEWVAAWQERYLFDNLHIKDKVSEFAARYMTGSEYVGRSDYNDFRKSYKKLHEDQDNLGEIISKANEESRIRLRVYEERKIKKLPDDVQAEFPNILQ